MPFNASGVFQRLFNWRNDRDAGIKILAERMDQEMDGIVAGINDIVQGEINFKGPITGVYGTAAAPAFSFQSDPNTGVYRSGTDKLALAAGGQKVFEASKGAVTSVKPFAQGNLKIENGEISMRDGANWIDNDGSYQYYRAGHDRSNDHSVNGTGAVQVRLGHGVTDPEFRVRIGMSGALGASVSWAKELTAKASGALTWGGNAIYHYGNRGDAPFLRKDAANPEIQMGSGEVDNWDGIRYSDADNAFRLYADQEPGVSAPLLEVNKATGLFFKGSTVWHEGNDGSGSGLDADKLDNLHANSFLRADANDTATGTITVEGALQVGKTGSGDSILRFRDSNSNVWRDLVWDDSEQGLRVEDNSGTMRTIWHAGNDGSGSGLDADKLDGAHRTQFVRSDVDDTVLGNLWFKALQYFQRPGDEQIRLGIDTGAQRNAYVSFYDGENTRRGYIQTTPTRLKVVRDGGAILDLFGTGDARVNGGHIAHAGQSSTAIGTFIFAQNNSGSTKSKGQTTAGSNLKPGGHAGVDNSTLPGTWVCRGHASNGWITLWQRVA